jgi:hypothetical protein
MKYVYWVVAVIAVLVVTFATVKKVSPAGWGWWGTTNVSSGVSLKGHDAVAYFETGSTVAGVDEFSYEWADAIWHFSSQENRDKFAATPDKFAPQFGGFCAFAMSKGFTADSSPDAWHVENGRLYVFADQNVRDDWVAQLPDGSLAASEQIWKKR